ncbi:MAG: ADP-ribosylglycohydrolase family protein [Gemmatimonadota bacterium]|nr:ADP-ribosylglycohydrolase family protein [Gemmatimonadota bacterium]
MLGAVTGDIIGSQYERRRTMERDFPLFGSRSVFTDDTVLTVAVAAAIVDAREQDVVGPRYGDFILAFARRWPHAGYGGGFREWMRSPNPQPYNSWGNGSAMRVSAIGFAFDSVQEVLGQAARSAAVTHDHPHGIAGAQAVALAVYLARTGATKAVLKREIASRFGYELDRHVDDIRKVYSFDVSCQGSVPEAIIAFLEADDLEHAIRNAIWLGGDADTQACIAGAIAEPFFGSIPTSIAAEVNSRIPQEFAQLLTRIG